MSDRIADIIDAHEACRALQADIEAAADKRAELIRAAMANGAGAVAIAEALGVTRARVYAMIRQ